MKTVRLTEAGLRRIVKRIISESQHTVYADYVAAVDAGDVVAIEAAGKAINQHMGANQLSANAVINRLEAEGMGREEAEKSYNKIVAANRIKF